MFEGDTVEIKYFIFFLETILSIKFKARFFPL
jgi:hypothetical protein